MNALRLDEGCELNAACTHPPDAEISLDESEIAMLVGQLILLVMKKLKMSVL